VAEWRVGRGWSEEELELRLAAIRGSGRNFDPAEPKTPDRGWSRHGSETVVAREPAGPPRPGGSFARGREAITRYEFSDPRIVEAHFDPAVPLEDRHMLLELKPLALRFLAGVKVGAVRDEQSDIETVFGFRYDTLAGHVESGWEWFILTKSHATGEVRFRIQADWKPGDFPNWWSRVGFAALGIHYQRRWTRRSHARLRHILEERPPVPRPEDHLLHEGPRTVQENST
jgi:uncharacterized protein (UPF0548 family)